MLSRCRMAVGGFANDYLETFGIRHVRGFDGRGRPQWAFQKASPVCQATVCKGECSDIHRMIPKMRVTSADCCCVRKSQA